MAMVIGSSRKIIVLKSIDFKLIFIVSLLPKSNFLLINVHLYPNHLE